ncbi:leucine-rich repeat protein [Brachyspira hampsonii]|uniref:Uncharacterized protein n=1 Tax=Brachyspira hampsonii TaxID=1287055 RepID=A0AAC9TQF2_9SPIR|nr:leucine-rich repeat protein [Brachyspira hampsonii]ASJ20975.1 hypothetical protein BHAMNSH16_04680 [Brachyspira hampsonii]ELV05033.1 hypothetical protein H263_12619 [Brachyspira hampsonii 30599]MBW5381562.1 hypothetical protein [Brachyspira hampsonii]MBW5410512.1 hypothetical protein [Brachyspira hampsonii]OEJ13295.1 hypothetical protein A9496_02490 [Brachyspira hampsonii]
MKILVIILLSFIIYSCNYKLISPYDDKNNNQLNNNQVNEKIYVVGNESTEEEIKNALENNKKETGQNLITVKGYIDSSSTIFDKIKNVAQNEKDIILDLSAASFETSYKFTLEGASTLKTVIMATTEQITANFFKDCTALVNIQISSSTIKINDTSFENCTSLKNVEYLGTSPNALTTSAFASIKPTDLYLPNVKTDPQDGRWNNFLGAAWTAIHYTASMPQ